ncbi:MAG: precorrin-3B C(17)-methyltransferase [Thiotrichales bacterium]|jgi:precorrin-3B C17-methyltransferase|nr:precorrin-3B C(17)-methyltransferase [Thiotrichales bacterium]MBT3613004.1 precorrin-3B C(17)-methyltransferase [Thiotrichales bacterium]MBT3752694.1 precorrin-3B C(17)-methyltransferase [Thiotrichales bacterium]MBT3837056.1 precorrin-3B C(17)-methyltransferase [Thiotrichales bacterium]MBT4152911.1 precorrin-3B C(17)-methyltransferase [Thiotrichales bacterium]
MAGKILMVGFGPGDAANMTQRAREAIAEADVVIGYSTYIKLVKNMLDGKEVIRKGMTEEVDRSIEAYQHAKLGKCVALISSGDIGIYGMAGPTYEVLFQAGWSPNSEIKVEIIPGVTALSACASLVGAPLTHDFCSISLSDLLTPWPTIANRVEAAAASDFVVALYNPKSGRRTGQIVEAQKILLRHRDPKTPVAIIKSAYRALQDIQMTTLDKMSEHKIGMLTTVLVGNHTTTIQQGMMVTPRGYANKYESLTGEVKAGERAGHSLGMGLNGWGEVVREWLRDNPNATLKSAADYFMRPVVEIMQAITKQSENDMAGLYEVALVKAEERLNAVTASENWGIIRAIVRSDAGAVAEMVSGNIKFELREEWLNLEQDSFHLHIHWDKVDSVWFSKRGESQRGVYMLDKYGHIVSHLLLAKELDLFDPASEQKFFSSWNSFNE